VAARARRCGERGGLIRAASGRAASCCGPVLPSGLIGCCYGNIPDDTYGLPPEYIGEIGRAHV